MHMGLADNSLYSNLFRYVPREKRSPLEDFSTEALADLLNRLLEKKGPTRRATEVFLTQVLCDGQGKDLDQRLRSAERLIFGTQRRVFLKGNRPRRLDLCLYADKALALVIENKVRETRGRAEYVTDDPSKTAKQLEEYAQYLRGERSDAGLVLLSIDEGPGDFLSDEKRYPASFRSVCRWPQVWLWLTKLASRNNLEPELLVFIREFILFLKEKNMDDIDAKEFQRFGKSLPVVCDYLETFDNKLREILKDARKVAEKTLPQYKKQLLPASLPASNVRSDVENAIGDFAYCYDSGTKDWELMKLKWYVGWGFQCPNAKAAKGAKVQAFVCIESDYDGTLIPLPPAKEKTELEEKGWTVSPKITDDEGSYSLFLKVCDPETFLGGPFTKASSDWFRRGIKEAAQILKTAKKALK